MRTPRVLLALAGLLALAFGLGWFALRGSSEGLRDDGSRSRPIDIADIEASKSSGGSKPSPIPLYGDQFIDDSGYALSCGLVPGDLDRSSVEAIAEALEARGEVGVAHYRGLIEDQGLDASDRLEDVIERIQHRLRIGVLELSLGRVGKAIETIERALRDARRPELPKEAAANIEALLGIARLRGGELENCVACLGPSSCLVPIDSSAVHQFPEWSESALTHLTAYLEARPEDISMRWPLNVAAMTLGRYPDGVPEAWRIPLDRFRSLSDAAINRFENVALAVGFATRGPNMAGGSVFDDFNGDGLPDVVVTSFDPDLGAGLFLNQGDGSFRDASIASGLADQPLALNASAADFDNDGDLDLLLVRGGWEGPAPLTLLENDGSGRFEDVTAEAGLDRPIASHAAVWADYDLDGDLDLFVCGEYLEGSVAGLYGDPDALVPEDPRNRCRLYRNDGDGRFENVAAQAGVENLRYAKGAAWGDSNRDGWPDLFVSNAGDENRLYRNNGDGTFTDEAAWQGVESPVDSFGCWWFDFDNDGRLDLFVAPLRAELHDVVAELLGRATTGSSEPPHLFRNLGEEGFVDITEEVGLNRVFTPMGLNFGDIDNDGYLDAYLATGRPSFSWVVPNVMLRNVRGERFHDVTLASGTGHLQKGHGVSFADYDRDGDLDLFAQLGGAVPGDRSHNALFRNPGHDRPSIQVRLVGTTSNRDALGAWLELELNGPNGRRVLHRQVGPGASYGGNSRTVHFGLEADETAERLRVFWPRAEREPEVFEGLEPGGRYRIVEGRPSPIADAW